LVEFVSKIVLALYVDIPKPTVHLDLPQKPARFRRGTFRRPVWELAMRRAVTAKGTKSCVSARSHIRIIQQHRPLPPCFGPLRGFNPADRIAKDALYIRRVRDGKPEFRGQPRQLRTPDRRDDEDRRESMRGTFPENTPGGGARSRIVELAESFDQQNIEDIAGARGG
jgi:hypothetical protein